MALNYFVDIFENDSALKNALGESYDSYRFVNFLKYVSERYDISVVALADLLGVTRQSLYNYFKGRTNELPSKIKDKVCGIYGALDFEEVLEKEKKVEIATYNEKPLLDEVSNDVGINLDPRQLDEFEVYTLESIGPASQRIYEVHLIDKYRFKKLWNAALRQKKQGKSVPSSLPKTETNSVEDEVASFLDKHSKEYRELLLKLINDNVKGDDLEFLRYVKNYKKTMNRENIQDIKNSKRFKWIIEPLDGRAIEEDDGQIKKIVKNAMKDIGSKYDGRDLKSQKVYLKKAETEDPDSFEEISTTESEIGKKLMEYQESLHIGDAFEINKNGKRKVYRILMKEPITEDDED